MHDLPDVAIRPGRLRHDAPRLVRGRVIVLEVRNLHGLLDLVDAAKRRSGRKISPSLLEHEAVDRVVVPVVRQEEVLPGCLEIDVGILDVGAAIEVVPQSDREL